MAPRLAPDLAGTRFSVTKADGKRRYTVTYEIISNNTISALIRDVETGKEETWSLDIVRGWLRD